MPMSLLKERGTLMSDSPINQGGDGQMPDKRALYGRYNDYSKVRAGLDVDNRRWQSQLHKQASHKALDEPMMDEDMGDIYAPKTITNTGMSGIGLLGLAAIALPLMGVGGAGAAVLLNQWINRPTPPAVEQPVDDTVAIPWLQFGPERVNPPAE
jgi:hypothetical protein